MIRPPRTGLAALALLLIATSGGAQRRSQGGAEQVQIPTEDGITVYADLHLGGSRPGAPVLVFFHDGSSSRGEVRPILKPFRALGYPTLSVDLRVGQKVKKVQNFTARLFPEHRSDQDILSARHDLEAALSFARTRFPDSRVVAVGCSFSAAHALRLAGTRPELLDGVIAFSPAEFFTHLADSETWVRDAMGGVTCPVLILSARAEQEEWRPLLEAIPSPDKHGFVPPGAGRHGLRALWDETAEHEAYWEAVRTFLARYFPAELPHDGDGSGASDDEDDGGEADDAGEDG